MYHCIRSFSISWEMYLFISFFFVISFFSFPNTIFNMVLKRVDSEVLNMLPMPTFLIQFFIWLFNNNFILWPKQALSAIRFIAPFDISARLLAVDWSSTLLAILTAFLVISSVKKSISEPILIFMGQVVKIWLITREWTDHTIYLFFAESTLMLYGWKWMHES